MSPRVGASPAVTAAPPTPAEVAPLIGRVPTLPADAVAVSVTMQAHGPQRWWRVPSVGVIWTDGSDVLVEPAADVDWSLVMLLLAGPVAAEAVWRQGGLPVRGSAASTRDRRRVLLFGRCAVGVSTLARTLVRRGGGWIGDELLAVYPPASDDAHRRAQVVGPSPEVLLPADSCARLGISAEDRAGIRTGTAKLRSDVPQWSSQPQPLDWLVRLDTRDQDEPSWVRRRDSAATATFLAAFAASCYGSAARNLTGEGAEQFRRVCAVADVVRRGEFFRPDEPGVRINANARALEAMVR